MTGKSAGGFVEALFARPYLLLVLTALLWAGNAVAGRLAVGQISPMLVVTLRWGLVVVILAVFFRDRIRAEAPALRPHLGFLAAMGSLGFTAFNALFYFAAHHTTAVNIGIIQGAIPIFTLIGAYLAYRTGVSALQAAGAAVTILGVVVVATKGDPTALASLTLGLGDLLMIVACALYAGYTVGLRNKPPVSGIVLFAGMAAAAAFTSLPLLALEIAAGRFQAPTALGWVLVVYIAVGPSFLSQLFFMRGVELIGPGRAGLFVNLVPVFAPVLAVAILGEAFTLFHAVALGLVLGGIFLAERGK